MMNIMVLTSRTTDYDYAVLTLCEELTWAKVPITLFINTNIDIINYMQV